MIAHIFVHVASERVWLKDVSQRGHAMEHTFILRTLSYFRDELFKIVVVGKTYCKLSEVPRERVTDV